MAPRVSKDKSRRSLATAPRWDNALFAKVEWMTYYNGMKPRDPMLQADGTRSEWGHEARLFQRDGGMYYGAIYTLEQPARRSIAIERLGAETEDDSVGNVPVIFLARYPEDPDPKQHLRLVGFYAKARVFRDLKMHNEEDKEYNITCPVGEAKRLPLADRTPYARLGWYADNPYRYFKSVSDSRRSAFERIVKRCRRDYAALIACKH
jgi:hypothetical protein